MSDRPDWIPSDVADEDIERWADTLGGWLARVEWEAKRDGAHDILAEVDQARALLRGETERLMVEHFRS